MEGLDGIGIRLTSVFAKSEEQAFQSCIAKRLMGKQDLLLGDGDRFPMVPVCQMVAGRGDAGPR